MREQYDDCDWMSYALKEAQVAYDQGEIPVGAVIVRDGEMITASHNKRERDGDATAHAEILAIRKAGNLLGGWRLMDCTLYVTVEPCIMCAGAILQARLPRLVFGAHDPKAWGHLTIHDVLQNPALNHRVEITAGVGGDESRNLMKSFFKGLRSRGN